MDSLAGADSAAVEVRAVIGEFWIRKKKIMAGIEAAEAGTSGEIRVHLSYDRKEQDLLEQAKKRFHELGMTNTLERNAVLIYVNPALRKFALFGDQGIHEKVGEEFWLALTPKISERIHQKSPTEGILLAVQIVGEALKAHFPAHEKNPNELPNDLSKS